MWTPWIVSGPPSKPLVGILGDVDGRIVPVAPRHFLFGQVVLEAAVATDGNGDCERTSVPTA
jgi:hypothetical protein